MAVRLSWRAHCASQFRSRTRWLRCTRAGSFIGILRSFNVMVTEAGQVKVLDFGLAKLLDENEAEDKGIHRTELTEVGVPYGTATYGAPEQARGGKGDARADIFSTD